MNHCGDPIPPDKTFTSPPWKPDVAMGRRSPPAPVDRRWHATGDRDHLGEPLQTVGLIGPPEAEQRRTTLVDSRIDGIQIAAATLDHTNRGEPAEG